METHSWMTMTVLDRAMPDGRAAGATASGGTRAAGGRAEPGPARLRGSPAPLCLSRLGALRCRFRRCVGPFKCDHKILGGDITGLLGVILFHGSQLSPEAAEAGAERWDLALHG